MGKVVRFIYTRRHDGGKWHYNCRSESEWCWDIMQRLLDNKCGQVSYREGSKDAPSIPFYGRQKQQRVLYQEDGITVEMIRTVNGHYVILRVER